MSFTSELKTFTEVEAKQYISRVVRTTVLEIGNRLVLRSPVGNPDLWITAAPPGYVGGAFRANWQYGFSAEPEGSLAAIDESGRVSIERIMNGVMAAPVAGIHYIVNNLPYGESLENGHSSQAPQGIVGLTELEFEGIFRQAAA